MAQKAKGLLKRMEWFTRVKALPERAAVSGEKQKAARRQCVTARGYSRPNKRWQIAKEIPAATNVTFTLFATRLIGEKPAP